ncbi:helix-turn-helix transcriptional regulator [Nocardioides mesophilus]|uniref:YafY family transcriptional regulator n=1 Tax=Nocardioides mesophilus TaxID=433659 RepID=A0A7G9R8W3_9ACTN|nr:YafY family protein [Nocardioides mesophilus]QNN52038.1 YafY family transcriptional regulator [Nocardioides mesophilus]
MAQTTTGRVLQLLGLLQSRPVWTGPELAEHLGVTVRSVRRDVDRLRDLGYPVQASKGVGGGYRLGAGRALPPLLLDAEEAVAVAVCLRLAAGGTVAGVGEAALRTMTKLDQVLPGRLRAQVAALQEATVTLESSTTAVDPEVLLTLARASRDHRRVELTYLAHGGEESQRRLEPYQMVATGRRWYLLAWDLDREDWRSFRLDRMSAVRATTWGFRPREAPDARAYVAHSITRSPYRHVARVRFEAPAAVVSDRVPATAGTVEPDGADACVLTTGADHLEHLCVYLAQVGAPFTVLDPPELQEVVRRLADTLTRAANAVPSDRR